MPVNVKLLKKVRKLIAEEPRRLQMGVWGIRKGNVLYPKTNAPPCGTVACLAGHILLASKPKKQWRQLFTVNHSISQTIGEKVSISSEAAELIGIPQNDCPFWRTSWGVPEVLAWIDRQIDAASK